MSKWLNTCSKYHDATCTLSNYNKLPTRVIDVGCNGSSTQPRLTEPRGLHGKYTALSYCWGKTPFFKMTSVNKRSLMVSIPLEKLPKTIQDAVHLTKLLGIQYLWVDSLCIIQGTDQAAQEDWKRQSSQMRAVFGGAFLTIAASGSTNANSGFFIKRVMGERHDCIVSASKADKTAVVLGYERKRTAIEREPLSQRGWAFQERILSTRILSFGSSEVSWICRGLTLWESEFELRRLPNPKLNLSMSLQAEAELLYTEWMNTVENYSSTSLTSKSDRLPAIEGIIDFVHVHYKKDICVAGVWKKMFRAHLLWIQPPRSDIDDFLTSNDEYVLRRTPSWSWVSVDSRVRFIKPYACQHIKERVQKKVTARLLFISPLSITIWGCLGKITSIRRWPMSEYEGIFEIYPPWRSFIQGMRTWVDDINAIPSCHLKTATGPHPRNEIRNVWFLFIRNYEGLILIKEGSLLKRKFRRIGVFWGYVGATFSESIVTIV